MTPAPVAPSCGGHFHPQDHEQNQKMLQVAGVDDLHISGHELRFSPGFRLNSASGWNETCADLLAFGLLAVASCSSRVSHRRLRILMVSLLTALTLVCDDILARRWFERSERKENMYLESAALC